MVVVVFHLQRGERRGYNMVSSEAWSLGTLQGTEAHTGPDWEALGRGSSAGMCPSSDAISLQLWPCSHTRRIPSGHMQATEEGISQGRVSG